MYYVVELSPVTCCWEPKLYSRSLPHSLHFATRRPARGFNGFCLVCRSVQHLKSDASDILANSIRCPFADPSSGSMAIGPWHASTAWVAGSYASILRDPPMCSRDMHSQTTEYLSLSTSPRPSTVWWLLYWQTKSIWNPGCAIWL